MKAKKQATNKASKHASNNTSNRPSNTTRTKQIKKQAATSTKQSK